MNQKLNKDDIKLFEGEQLDKDNKFNLQSMLLTKSSSLPLIHNNYSKFDQFFTNKAHAKELAMEEYPQQTHNPEQLTHHDHSNHARNLEIIHRKSSLRNKVDTYLTNSSKLGILDHTRQEIHNRKSLTRVSQDSLKPFRTELEQQASYLTKLKSQLNFYFEKNKRTEGTIKNTQAMMNQIKQRIIFFEQLLSRSWADRAELLKQREENIVYIRFESDRLNYLKQRLKNINIWMKLQVKEAQKNLKQAELDFNKIAEVDCNEQADLDRKRYLIRQYYNYQTKQSQEVAVQTSIAIGNLQEHQAAQILKQQQDRITIMEPSDYLNEVRSSNHQKLMKELILHKSLEKMLAAIGSKYSCYYESYEKAEQMIKMHCMDRNSLVQDSYRKSFEVKAEIKDKIQKKEVLLRQLQKRNEQLQQLYQQCYFKQNEELEKRLNSVQLQYKTGKKLEKQAKEKQIDQFQKNYALRIQRIDFCKSLLMRLKQWVIKQKQSLDLSISKNLPLIDHLKKIIEFVTSELKNRQATFSITKLAPGQNKLDQLPDKKGIIKKKK